eukprot:COSAG02_NODE_2806_length_7991_cov_21.891916_4_plen_191_part_00
MIRRQAELVCQQAAQSLSSTATTHTTSQVALGPEGANTATNTRFQAEDEQDTAAEVAARAELEQLAAQGTEIERLAAKEALAELEAQTRAAQPIAVAKEAKQHDHGSFDAHDEDAPYVSSDEDDETIRKRISMAVDNQSPTTYTSSGNRRTLTCAEQFIPVTDPSIVFIYGLFGLLQMMTTISITTMVTK